jgi:hypothetical protein
MTAARPYKKMLTRMRVADDDNVLNGHSGILYYIQPRKKRTHLLYDLTSMLHCFN